ncbi:hypothetical protein [Pseudoneobacillus sp. C159]
MTPLFPKTERIFSLVLPYDELSLKDGGIKAEMNNEMITKEMLCEYADLLDLKKDIEKKLELLKKSFHLYFDEHVGVNEKGELTIDGYKLQRQIRKVEKFDDAKTVDLLESLNMTDLIKVIKKPDEEKVRAAVNLGFLKEEDLEGCLTIQNSGAIVVRQD